MKIAVIGGTGLQSMDGAEFIAHHEIETEYGMPSSVISELRLNSQSIFFLARHGEDQQTPPHLINYRANIKALSDLGVTAILAVTAVGGVLTDYGVGDLVIPDQIIDYTWGRESTFFDGFSSKISASSGRRHIDFTYPYTESLRQVMFSARGQISRPVHVDGVYGCTQGPRLETAAEVVKLRNDGVSVVGMTGMPEACLARELGIDYASLSVVVNAAAGMNDVELSELEIELECHAAALDIKQLLTHAIRQLSAST